MILGLKNLLIMNIPITHSGLTINLDLLILKEIVI